MNLTQKPASPWPPPVTGPPVRWFGSPGPPVALEKPWPWNWPKGSEISSLGLELWWTGLLVTLLGLHLRGRELNYKVWSCCVIVLFWGVCFAKMTIFLTSYVGCWLFVSFCYFWFTWFSLRWFFSLGLIRRPFRDYVLFFLGFLSKSKFTLNLFAGAFLTFLLGHWPASLPPRLKGLVLSARREERERCFFQFAFLVNFCLLVVFPKKFFCKATK